MLTRSPWAMGWMAFEWRARACSVPGFRMVAPRAPGRPPWRPGGGDVGGVGGVHRGPRLAEEADVLAQAAAPPELPRPGGVGNELEPLDHDGEVALVHLDGDVLEVEGAAHGLRAVLGRPPAHAAHHDVVVDEALAPARVPSLEDGIGPVRGGGDDSLGYGSGEGGQDDVHDALLHDGSPSRRRGAARVEERAFGRTRFDRAHGPRVLGNR